MKFFLITTQHNVHTRHEYVKKHLDGVDFQVVMAPDYRVFIWAGLDIHKARHNSLTMAYWHIAQMAIFDNLKAYVVMEDDIHFEPEFWEDGFMNIIDTLPEDWDFCYLTKTEHNRQAGKTLPVNTHLSRVVANWWETPLTMWRKSMAEYFDRYVSTKLSKELFIGNIDHELLKICEAGEKVFYASERNLANGLSSAPQLENHISLEGSISE